MEIRAKANHLLVLIRKSFEYLEPDMLVKLFATMVRPTLECSDLYGDLIIFWIREI